MIDSYFVLSTEMLRHARILTASCCYAKYGCQARIRPDNHILHRNSLRKSYLPVYFV